MPETTTITLPVSADILSVIAILLGLLVASALISLALPRGPKTGAQMEQSFIYRWFRIMDLGPIERVIVGFALLAMAVLFLMALAATLTIVIATILGGLDPSAARGFGTGALLVALLGSPFLIWRSMVAQSTLDETRLQTKLQDEALFNDKINAAAKDLAARHQVSKTIGRGKLQRVLTEWQDDLVTRAAAIDRLEDLALEAFENDDAPGARRIARMLATYVQELNRMNPPKEMPVFLNGRQEQRLEFADWAQERSPTRANMERAVQSLGKINATNQKLGEAFDAKVINLRKCNLQGFDLRGLDLQGFRLEEASLMLADLTGAYLKGTSLWGADLRRVNLDNLDLSEADLINVSLKEAQISNTNLDGARLDSSSLRSASLENVSLRMSNLAVVDLEHASLKDVVLDGDILEDANFQHSVLELVSMDSAKAIDAHFGFAKIRNTSFRGTLLRPTSIAPEFDLGGNDFRGAGVWQKSSKNTNAPKLAIGRSHWPQIFYAATALPDGAPDHWVAEDLDYYDFIDAWRAWAAEHHPDITIAPDYRHDD